MGRCESAAVAFLAEQALCLSHFLWRCYDQLDRLDPRGRRYALGESELRNMREALEEYSEQTLRVCLSETPLDNLERGRLLDILLRAGELYILLRMPPRSGGPLCDWNFRAPALAPKAVEHAQRNRL